jgi:hypothetical protein
MTKTKFRILLLVILFLCNAATFAKETWFNQRVTWKYGKEGLAWKTNIKEPNGQAEYQLVLQPLWAVEGGVVALVLDSSKKVAGPAGVSISSAAKRPGLILD